MNNGNKTRNVFIQVVAMVIVILCGLMVPTTTMASEADGSKYQMTLWKFGVVGNTAGININYIGKDGVHLSRAFPLDYDSYKMHGDDPAWTGINSAFPFLSYIKENGKDSNIRETFDVTYYDPAILKALEGQGISLSQLGGSATPLEGQIIFPVVAYKNVVGIGIPVTKPSVPKQETPTPTPVPKPVVATPTPIPQPVSVPTPTQPEKTPDLKIETKSNPALETTSSTSSDMKPVPNQVSTTDELKPLAEGSSPKVSEPAVSKPFLSWVWAIVGAVAIALGILTVFKTKRRKNI